MCLFTFLYSFYTLLFSYNESKVASTKLTVSNIPRGTILLYFHVPYS